MAHPWRVYVGAEIPCTEATSHTAITTPAASAAIKTAPTTQELLDSAFARRARLSLATTPLATRQHPSSAASPVLRWLLQMEQSRQAAAATTAVNTTSAATTAPDGSLSAQADYTDVTVGTGTDSTNGAARHTDVVAVAPTQPQVGVTALARRGVGPKDPLIQRLLKKQQQQQQQRQQPVMKSSAPVSSEAMVSTCTTTGTSHWTQHPYSAMSATSWRVFRQQLGITVELVAPARPQATSLSMPAADSLPAIRCWEEAQLPLSLGRCVTRLYSLPTAVQAQCVPLALLPTPADTLAATTTTTTTAAVGITPSAPSWAAAVASSLGMDVLAVAETGSGKTAAYLVPLLYHVICRAPELLGHPDRISLGPLSLVIVPTRELAEQVTASLLQLCGKTNAAASAPTPIASDGVVRRADILAWEAEEVEGVNAGSPQQAQSSGRAPARNRLSELRVVKVVGGESREAQYAALSNGAHCVVGTVGQLQMLLEDRFLSLGNSQFVVMDEADRMIDEQQESKLTAVLQRCPVHRQTLMFTATLSAACAGVARRYLARSGYYMVRTPYRCASIRQSFELLSSSTTTADDDAEKSAAGSGASGKGSQPPRQQRRVEGSGSKQQQQQRRVSALLHPQKFARLVAWLVYGTGPIIVFANVKATCDALFEELRAEAEHLDAQQEYFTLTDLVGTAPDGLIFREAGSDAAAATTAAVPGGQRRTPSLLNLTSTAVVHSELSQNERRALVAQFQRRQRQVLITTDLLARGLDVAGVTLVVNYDLPWTVTGTGADAVTMYIHRIGRTGRAGSTGVTVSFVELPAAMVQRAEEVVKDGGVLQKQQSTARGNRANVKRNDDDDDPMQVAGELFDGDTHSVWVTGAGSKTGRGTGEEEEEGGNEDHGGEAEEVGNVSDSDGEEGGGAARGVRKTQRRGGRAKSTATSDVAVLRPLWFFLTACAEGEGVRDGAAALCRGSYAKISMPSALACIMAQLSATSQYGHITL